MGAWGCRNLENDDAGDWLVEFIESGDEASVRDVLKRVIDAPADADLESPDCCIALAAAEVVAASLERASSDYAEMYREADDIPLIDPISPDMRELAIRAANRIAARSELRDLWAEVDSEEEWKRVIDDLRHRLSDSGA